MPKRIVIPEARAGLSQIAINALRNQYWNVDATIDDVEVNLFKYSTSPNADSPRIIQRKSELSKLLAELRSITESDLHEIE